VDTVLITGAPASGKLTIARLIVERTGFRLFHNQLTVNFASSLFDFNSDDYRQLAKRLRLLALFTIARAPSTGLVATFCYGGQHSDYFVDAVCRAAARTGGHAFFVHLICSVPALEERLRSPERQNSGKLTSADILHQVLSSWAVKHPVPGRRTCTIATDAFPPNVVASQILEWISDARNADHSPK